MARPKAAQTWEDPKSFGNIVKSHTRYTTSDGKRVPGGSTIANVINEGGDALIGWANRMGLDGIDTRAYTNETARVGSLAHAMIEQMMGGETLDTSDFTANQIERATWAFESFKKWHSAHNFETYAAELPLVSDEFKFGGTIDWYGKMDGQYTLLDFKTSKQIRFSHVLQISGYTNLARLPHIHNETREKSEGLLVDRVGLVKIGRADGSLVEVRWLSEPTIEIAWKLFRHSLVIYRLKKELDY